MHYISVSRIGRVVAVLTLGIATATLLCGCARVRRVSASDVMTTPQATVPAQPIAVPMPPTTIQPPSPITSVPAPPTVIKPPQAKEVEGKPTETKPVEEKPAKPSVDVRKDIERLNELTAQLEQAVVAGKVADFVPQLLQVLLQLAYVEVHAVDEIRASGDILRVSDVIEAVDALRSNLREVRNALERGNQRIAGAAFDEVKAQLPKLQTLIMEAIGAKKKGKEKVMEKKATEAPKEPAPSQAEKEQPTTGATVKPSQRKPAQPKSSQEKTPKASGPATPPTGKASSGG